MMAEIELVPENPFDPEPESLSYIIKSNPDLHTRFCKLIGEREIIHISGMHERGTVTPYGDLTIFYRYFLTKYVSLRQENDARSSVLDKHAAIFPFKTHSNLKIKPVAVSEFFNDEFSSEIRKFVDYHFGNAFDFKHLRNLFLTNIDHFKTQNFQDLPSWLELSRVIAVGSTWRDQVSPENILSEYPYLKEFIRLNDAGVEWYAFFQTKFNDICKLYRKESLRLPEKSESYFKYLPEINCCELLLLLETDFYQKNRRKYTEIFRKYLFFFGHAITSADPHPVCFIDETLFKCLQFKRLYETFRGDILKLQWELWMMTLVHRRKHSLPKHSRTNQKVDENNLKDVIGYASRIPNVESAVVYYSEPQYRRFRIFLVFDDVAFLMGYSGHTIGNDSCYDQIIKSALISREIRTIKYYNAYLGLESRFEMPPNKTDICDFIREVNELHKPAPLYPEKFLVQDLESYFEKLPAIALH